MQSLNISFPTFPTIHNKLQYKSFNSTRAWETIIVVSDTQTQEQNNEKQNSARHKWSEQIFSIKVTESYFLINVLVHSMAKCWQLRLILETQKHYFVWHKPGIFLSWWPCFEAFAPGGRVPCWWRFAVKYCLNLHRRSKFASP